LIRLKESQLGIRRSLLVFIVALSGGMASFANADGAAELVDDPWLSQQGPAVAEPVEVAKEQVIEAWTTAPQAAFARTAALRRVRLELGAADLVAPASVILKGATEDDPEIYSEFAVDLAPATPLFRWAHVRALVASGDVGAAMRATVDAIWSVVGSLSAQLWLIENFSLIALMVVLGAPLGFVLLSALHVFPHAAHDVGDLLGGRGLPVFAGSAALAAFLLVPFSLGEGVMGFALSLFALAFAYGKSHQRKVLVMAAVLLVIGLHPLAQFVSVATTLVDQDPVARSVMAVVSGLETNADVERLESVVGQDPVAAHALVVRARRYGLEEQSRIALEALDERYPSNGHVLAALGSIEMRRDQTEAAIGFYERAAPQVDSATLLFDLSQAYAAAFRMEEYEATLVKAQRLDASKVASLSSLGDARLVADLSFPVGLLYDRFQSLVLSQDLQFGLVTRLAPGRIGESWLMTAGSFTLVVLFGLLFANRFDHSSQCLRCGHRICTRCEETVWSEEICEDCHHLFQYPDSTDPSLRMARLQTLSRRGVMIDRIVLAASVLIPGVAGIASRRPDFAMFGLLLFSWIAAWIVWPFGVFDDPLLMGDAAWLCFLIPGVLAVLSYSGIVIASLVARKNF